MDFVTVPLVTFEQAARGLRRLRTPSFRDVYNGLIGAAFTLRCAGILQEIAPDRMPDKPLSGSWLVKNAVETFTDRAINAIDAIAPLDWEVMEADGMGEGYDRLAPASMGYPMMWDDWYETIEDLDGQGDDDSFYFFARCLLMDEEESFEKVVERWDLNLRYPKNNDAYYLDLERMEKRLKRQGLGVFITAWKVANYDTGNLYFDYNVYDDNEPLPSFSVEGVRFLQKQYQAALPLQQEFREAQRLFQEPRIPGVLLGIYKRSLVKREKQPMTQVVRAQTLAEMWGLHEGEYGEQPEARREVAETLTDEAHLTDILTDGGPELTNVLAQIREINREINENTNQLRRLIDPFYGPLDGRGDGDDEENDGNDNRARIRV